MAEMSSFLNSKKSDMESKQWFVSRIPLSMHASLTTNGKSKFAEALNRYTTQSNLACHEDASARVIFVLSEKCFQLNNSVFVYNESKAMAQNSEAIITTNSADDSDNLHEIVERRGITSNVELRHDIVPETRLRATSPIVVTSNVKRSINTVMSSASAQTFSASSMQTYVPGDSDSSDVDPDDDSMGSFSEMYKSLPASAQEQVDEISIFDLTLSPSQPNTTFSKGFEKCKSCVLSFVQRGCL